MSPNAANSAQNPAPGMSSSPIAPLHDGPDPVVLLVLLVPVALVVPVVPPVPPAVLPGDSLLQPRTRRREEAIKVAFKQFMQRLLRRGADHVRARHEPARLVSYRED
jgi:hypothetical protein